MLQSFTPIDLFTYLCPPLHGEQLESWDHTRILFNAQGLVSVELAKVTIFKAWNAECCGWVIINNISELVIVYYLPERMPVLSMEYQI